MKIQYYYSPSTKGIYCQEAHADNIPNDIIEITDELWTKKEQNPNYIFHYANSELDVVHLDSLLTPQELEERDNLARINQANYQLNATDKLHSGVYQRHMTESQLTEFNEWQDALYDVAYNGGTVLPDTPEFINEMGVL